MEFSFGYGNPTVVEITNKQNCVEYKRTSGIACDERDIRAAVGNVLRGTYDYSYSGWYSDRKQAINRIEEDIADLKNQLECLEFALKVTKKKTWVENNG